MSRAAFEPGAADEDARLASDRAAVLVTLHCFECVGREVAAISAARATLLAAPPAPVTRHSCLKVSSSQDFIRHGFGSCCNSGKQSGRSLRAANEEQAFVPGHVKSRRLGASYEYFTQEANFDYLWMSWTRRLRVGRIR